MVEREGRGGGAACANVPGLAGWDRKALIIESPSRAVGNERPKVDIMGPHRGAKHGRHRRRILPKPA